MKKGRTIKDLTAVVDYVKPSVLMGMQILFKTCYNKSFIVSGASGVGRLFHEAILKKMSQINERPVIFAL